MPPWASEFNDYHEPKDMNMLAFLIGEVDPRVYTMLGL